MAFFIVPHPSDRIFLADMQKKLLHSINKCKTNRIFPYFPLWLELDAIGSIDAAAETFKNRPDVCTENFQDFSGEETGESYAKRIKDALKKIKDGISLVQTKDVVVNKNGVLLSFTVEFDKKSYVQNMTLGTFDIEPRSPFFENIVPREIKDETRVVLPKNFRVFEIAHVKKEGYFWSADGSLWVKLKKTQN
ncbi:hypothetical protein HRQ91_08085 [Treponema parvum]|uniref:Uncharacterized protein n=1 Tax=Treponema parvum TaxID=138851 RepID=A0A975IEY1_9SPIR|nr:hypothetical protein [Treponema parvum]QTQ14416.1 hypothetical protein HRQ91_08085 [Treponema parvum]